MTAPDFRERARQVAAILGLRCEADYKCRPEDPCRIHGVIVDALDRTRAEGRDEGLEEAAKIAEKFERGRETGPPDDFLKLIGGDKKDQWKLMFEGGRLCAQGIAAACCAIRSTPEHAGEKV